MAGLDRIFGTAQAPRNAGGPFALRPGPVLPIPLKIYMKTRNRESHAHRTVGDCTGGFREPLDSAPRSIPVRPERSEAESKDALSHRETELKPELMRRSLVL